MNFRGSGGAGAVPPATAGVLYTNRSSRPLPPPPSALVPFQKAYHGSNYGNRTTDGDAVVRKLAQALRTIPKERVRWLKTHLWSHANKRRVRLQRVGGERGNNGRAYVIDRHTAVDGITRRMKNVVHNECKRASEKVARFYADDQEYSSARSALAQFDERYATCTNLFSRRRQGRQNGGGSDNAKNSAMAHGSKVHVDVYHIIRHALHVSGIHRSRRRLAEQFRVDPCAHACVMGLISKGLYPFSAEWPVFSTEGTGIATAVDALAFDRRNSFGVTLVELKTGSADKAMDMRVMTSRDISGYGMVAAALQVALSRELMLKCYVSAFVEHEVATALGAVVVYARSWGIVCVDVSYDTLSRVDTLKLLKVLLHHGGTTLRQSLPAHKNEQSHVTAKNKPRRRAPKLYRIGYENTAAGDISTTATRTTNSSH